MATMRPWHILGVRSVIAARRCTQNVVLHRTSASDSNTTTQEISYENAKPYNEIPGPRSQFVTYRDIFRIGGLKNMGKFYSKRRQQFGPFWRENMAGFNDVFVADPVAAKEIFRTEGKYPRRPPLDLWLLYRKLDGYSLGIFMSDMEDWHRHRSVLIKPLLRPNQVALYTDTLNLVADDLIAKVWHLRDSKDGTIKTGIEDDVFRWATEAVASTLFEKRLGLLDNVVDPISEKFIQGNKDFFKYSEAAFIFPFPKLLVKLNLPAWRKMRESARIIFETTEMHLSARMAKEEQSMDKTAGDSGKDMKNIIPYLISSGKLSHGEILANVAELFSAGVDTTSNTLIWTLDLLAWNPDVQEKLFQEINNVVGMEKLVTQDHLHQLHYLKAVVKESMRLFPVAYGYYRKLDKDIVLNGYKVPRGKIIAVMTLVMSRDPKYFDDPDAFKPERWLRNESKQTTDQINPFASQPFGAGPRQCIGRRLSELGLHLSLAKIIQNFRLESKNDKPLEPEMRLLLVPNKPLNLKFLERK